MSPIFRSLVKYILVDCPIRWGTRFRLVLLQSVFQVHVELLSSLLIRGASQTPNQAEDEDGLDLRFQIVQFVLRYLFQLRVLVLMQKAVQ